jgi:putative ABC transport system permease protein
VVLTPLPFDDVDELIRLRQTREIPGQPARATSVTGQNFRAWQERSTRFGDMAAARFRALALSGEGEAERIRGISATWNHFQVLGANPLIGRTFQADEDQPGNPAPVVVISHSLWSRRFGQDPDAVGGELVIGGRPHTVLGVMPQGFRYPYAAEAWVPLGLGPESDEWTRGNLNISARLVPDASFESAREEMERIAVGLQEERPLSNAGVGVEPILIRDEVLEGVDTKVRALLGAAIFVLLIGCANVATMVLARMKGRDRELAVRAALGASGSDLARPILAEAVLLSLASGTIGTLLAAWVGPPLAAMSPVDDLGPFFQTVRVDGRVLVFGILASLVVAVLFSLPSAFRTLGARAGAVLQNARGDVSGRTDRRILGGLVVAEIAVAVVLLTGAGLMLKTIQNVQSRDLGLEPEGLMTFGVAPAVGGYEGVPERLAFMDQALEAIRALPGVQEAAFTNFNPFRDQGWGATLWPQDRPLISENDLITVNHRAVSPGYFGAAGTEILAGRGFTRADGPDDPAVVVVSRRLADRLWPEGEALGKRIYAGRPSEGAEVLTVVGVAEDVADFGALSDTWYLPYTQSPIDFTTNTLEIFVRGGSDLAGIIESVRGAVRDLDPNLPVFDIESANDIVRFERRGETFTTYLLSLFAGVGLLLAAVGIYGVLSYGVSRRTRELGVRMALGAQRSDILGLVLRGAMLVSGLGLLLGLIAAGFLTRFLESSLVGVSPLDPTVFTGMALGAMLVAGAAACIPAWRAMLVDLRDAVTQE